MFNTTVQEACIQLGVSKTRVHQLIKSGVLSAEKIGNTWLIDENSIQARLDAPPKVGRPKVHSNGDSATNRYILMNRTHEVLSFRYDDVTGEFYDADEIFDAARAPLSIMSPRGTRASKHELTNWWAHRCIPSTRFGIDAKLAELGISDTYNLPFKCMGLSLSDQYWVRPYEREISWHDINFFDNAFIDSETGDWLSDVGLDSPDNTSDGVLSKRWICDGKKRFLIKGGSLLNQEPYNEVIATELHKRLLNQDSYVSYTLKKWNEEVVSVCPNFLTSSEEFIPAFYVLKSIRNSKQQEEYRRYIDQCNNFDVENIELCLAKMIVCDYILANTDRHWRNFGLIRNVETLQYRPAPLFDSGTSLWCHVPTRNMEFLPFECDSKPFYEDEKRQLRLVGDSSWLDLSRLSDFAEWAVDLLEQNPAMHGRTDYIFQGIQKRINYVTLLFGD